MRAVPQGSFKGSIRLLRGSTVAFCRVCARFGPLCTKQPLAWAPGVECMWRMFNKTSETGRDAAVQIDPVRDLL